MGRDGPRYPGDEIAKRAEEIYAKIKHAVDEGNHGRILAIDVESGEYEIDQERMAAVDRLFARLPDPQIYCLRIGYRAVLRFGGPRLKRTSRTGETSYDLVMEDEMSFIEGTFRIGSGKWEVFIFSKKTIDEPQIQIGCWESGATGIVVHVPHSTRLNKQATEQLMSKFIGVAEWREVYATSLTGATTPPLPQ